MFAWVVFKCYLIVLDIKCPSPFCLALGNDSYIFQSQVYLPYFLQGKKNLKRLSPPLLFCVGGKKGPLPFSPPTFNYHYKAEGVSIWALLPLGTHLKGLSWTPCLCLNWSLAKNLWNDSKSCMLGQILCTLRNICPEHTGLGLFHISPTCFFSPYPLILIALLILTIDDVLIFSSKLIDCLCWYLIISIRLSLIPFWSTFHLSYIP